MKKVLAILAVVWAFTIPAMAVQNQDSGSKHTAERQQVTPPSPTVTNNEATTYYQQSPEDKPKGWHKLIAWPEGITTWAIIFTFGAIIWQAILTRGAAGAGRDAAKAAALNAQALVNSERPWLIAEAVKSPRMPHFYEIEIKNVGRTPAKFLYGDAAHATVQDPEQLPVPPVYSSPIIVPNQILIAPNGGSFKTQGISVTHLLQGHDVNANVLVLYGRVVYEDTIIPGVQHETRWCYGYVAVSHGLMADFEFVLTGPDEYTKHG